MAFFAKALSFFFLLVLISPLQIQARESKFFSKFAHISTKNKAIPESQISQAPTAAPELAPTVAAEPTFAPGLAPTPEAEPISIPALVPTPATEPTITAEPVSAPAVAPTLFYAEGENGYGLYGHGSYQFPPTKETVTSTIDENDLLNEELSAENYKTGYQNGNYNNNAYGNNYNNNGHVTEKQGMSDTRFIQNYPNSMTENTNNNDYFNKNAYSNNYNNNGYTSNYNNNGYVTEKQGMSDTRFMQNYQNSDGNSEYATTTTTNNNDNVYSNNYNNNGYNSNTGYTGNYDNNGYSRSYTTNGYETEKQGMSDTRFLENGKYYYEAKNENNYYPNGFEPEKGTAANEAYYGISQNANEFNTMDEYDNRQGYQESPETFVP